MRTIEDVLISLRACERARKKYSNRRDFKNAFINASWQDASWLGCYLFAGDICGQTKRYLIYSQTAGAWYTTKGLALLFRKKANRIKYWPEVRRRLIELGVKL